MKDSHFNYWYNEIADMPEKDEDGWYDLETGLRYHPDAEYRPQRKPASIKTIEHRKVAKEYGGLALKGTHKQKAWAEDIRATKIQELNEHKRPMLVRREIEDIQHAKFWIENRQLQATLIYDILAEVIIRVAEYRAATDSETKTKAADKAKELASKLRCFSV